jgi:PAS domain S-box-containing protein
MEMVTHIRKDWPEFVSIMNKVITAMQQDELPRILNKWFIDWPQSYSEKKVLLTLEEQAWLREHKKIIVGGEKEWAPFDYVDASGNYVGIAKDYMDLTAKTLDIEMVFVTGPAWDELLEMARQKKIDVLPSIYHSKERESFLHFTNPYTYVTQFIFARDDTKGITSINDLRDKTVAVMKGAKMEGMLRSGYSDIKLVSTPSILNALEKVISHEADAFIGDITSASYLIKTHSLVGLKPVAPTSFDKRQGVYIGIRKDWPVLAGIINKVLASITDKEKAAIHQKYLAIKYEPGIDKAEVLKWILIGTGAAFGVILIFFFWNKQLSRKVKERTSQLMETESRFRATFEQAAVGVAHVSLDGEFLRVNEKFCEIVGYSEDEIRALTFQEITHPDDLDADLENVQQVLKGARKNYSLDKRYIRKDGSIVWVNLTISLLFDRGGNPKYFVSVIKDISERKEAEENLATSESKYRSLVDNSIVGVFNSNVKGEFLYVNKAMGKMLDFDSPELMLAEGSLPFWADQKRREQMLSALKQHGSVTNFEAETITNAGRHIYVLFSAKMFGENIFGMVMDITDRKEAEEALEISKANLVKAQEVGRIGSWNLDLLENSLVWTDEIYRIFGIPSGTLVTYKKFLAKVHPEDRDYVHRKWSAAIEGEPYDIEHRLLVGNEVKWVREKAEMSFDDKGNPIAGIGITQDITDRKQAEAELTKSYKEIEKLQKQLEVESAYLQEEIKLEHNFENIIGNSDAIQYALFKVEQVAQTDSTVLILGETGTGKELIARAIHHNSQRKDRPLIKINCATLPANLIESELFGHEKGSFTGAAVRHTGRFEVADKSTLFLDEIGELPFELQAKLLRVLEDGEFERLGSTRTLKVDVRIIAATNRDMEKDVSEGRFRQDLWYRLNVFPITLPPLRDRIEDIPMIVQYYVDKFTRKLGKKIDSIPAKVINNLQSYTWPGNVRELQNVLERAIIGSSGAKLQLAEAFSQSDKEQPEGFKSLYDMERDYIASVLEETGWKVSGKNSAAEILGLDRSTLRARMKKLDIHK